MDLIKKEREFEKIKSFFEKLDFNEKQKGEKLVYDTEKGIFGTSDLDTVFEFLKKINPSPEDIFVDLGSGDGRINILASIFCKSIAIEFDKKLCKKSKKYSKTLGTTIEVFNQDYETFDFSKATIIYSYADHFFTEEFIDKLKKEFTGKLYVYQGVFLPENIKKGPKIWAKNTPLITYEFPQ